MRRFEVWAEDAGSSPVVLGSADSLDRAIRTAGEGSGRDIVLRLEVL